MVEKLLQFFERFPLDFLSYVSSILPITVGLLRIRKLNRSEKLIELLFVLYFLKDTCVLVYIFTVPEPNTFYIENIEQIVTILLIGSIYYFSFEKLFQKRIILYFTITCGLIAALAYDNLTASTVSLSVSRMFSIALALIYFNKIIKDMRVKIITRHSLFWFTAALLLFSAGTFFIMLFSEYWYKETVSDDMFDFYWNKTQIMFIIFCCLSAYGLWVSKYEQENLI